MIRDPRPRNDAWTVAMVTLLSSASVGGTTCISGLTQLGSQRRYRTPHHFLAGCCEYENKRKVSLCRQRLQPRIRVENCRPSADIYQTTNSEATKTAQIKHAKQKKEFKCRICESGNLEAVSHIEGFHQEPSFAGIRVLHGCNKGFFKAICSKAKCAEKKDEIRIEQQWVNQHF